MVSKRELIRFLEQHVFDPIIKASPGRFSEADQGRLEDVQRRTATERARCRRYSNAEEIVNNFKSDLHSAAARNVNKELEKLKLPTLASVRDRLLELAEDARNPRH